MEALLDRSQLENRPKTIQEVASSEWAIFCPGPSLTHLSEYFKIDYSQAIAVNGALLTLHQKKLMAKYWALSDWDLFKTCVKIEKKERLLKGWALSVVLWVSDNWLTHMHRWCRDYPEAEKVFNKMRKEVYPRGRVDQVAPFEGEFGYTRQEMAYAILRWSGYTLFSAIALAILEGADRLKVYGADFAGEGYCREGLENKRTNHSQVRWQTERSYFIALQHCCRTHGIEIVREEIAHG
jgi:hypothetical protein